MTLPDCNNENDDDANVTKKTEQKDVMMRCTKKQAQKKF